MTADGELFDLYRDTIEKSGTNLLSSDDDDILYAIFEEFDIGMISFLHEDSLNRLVSSGYLNKELADKSAFLRQQALSLQIDGLWNLEEFRVNPRWKKLLELSDEIKKQLDHYRMTEITFNELYDLYVATINSCNIRLLEENDDKIDYQIFEEFASDVVTFLHPDNARKLMESGFISSTKMNKSIELRNKVLELETTNLWNVPSFRTSLEWRDIFNRALELKELK
jgi:hypothetical protein